MLDSFVSTYSPSLVRFIRMVSTSTMNLHVYICLHPILDMEFEMNGARRFCFKIYFLFHSLPYPIYLCYLLCFLCFSLYSLSLSLLFHPLHLNSFFLLHSFLPFLLLLPFSTPSEHPHIQLYLLLPLIFFLSLTFNFLSSFPPPFFSLTTFLFFYHSILLFPHHIFLFTHTNTATPPHTHTATQRTRNRNPR